MSSAATKSQWNLDEMIHLFKEFPLLQSFPERLLQTLAQAAELLELPPNTQILKQGQDNEHLYFLVEGQVGVYVDSGRVSKLQRKGDLLGEMSVISNRTVGATILSETRVVLVKVNARLFLDMQGKDRDLCISVLYRIYATVLAEKLATTNQKAKHFEELTLQLTATQAELEEINQNLERKVEERTQRLEAQNAELMASKNKMEELLNSKRMIFQKLSEFHDRQMIPLKKFLDEIRQRHPEEAAIQEARRVVFEVQRQLSPLTDLYSTEQAIQSKRVLLADSNKKQQIIAKMALGGTGVILDIASTVEEGRIQIQEQKYDLVVIDSKMLELGNIA
ncbi:MAG: cyclic nucleotide-binding domain-containing protein [Bdellovibrionales bacterium]